MRKEIPLISSKAKFWCERIESISPKLLGNERGCQVIVNGISLADILEELVVEFGEKGVIEWITEKPYNPIEHYDKKKAERAINEQELLLL